MSKINDYGKHLQSLLGFPPFWHTSAHFRFSIIFL